jgi:hypothetical protein
VLRAIPIEAGQHQVVLSFFPKSVDTTETVAYIALVLIILSVVSLVLLPLIRKKKA